LTSSFGTKWGGGKRKEEVLLNAGGGEIKKKRTWRDKGGDGKGEKLCLKERGG